MDEIRAIERERRMAESGQYEEPDWSFLEELFAHDPGALAEAKAGIERGKKAVYEKTSASAQEEASLESILENPVSG